MGFNGKIESALDAFQGRVARRLTGRQPCRGRDGNWFYPSLGGGSKGGRGREGQDIGPPETEYGRAIYCDETDSGALQGGGEMAGDMSPTAVVGTVRN